MDQKYQDAGAMTKSSGFETVDGPCGHLGDALGMGSDLTHLWPWIEIGAKKNKTKILSS